MGSATETDSDNSVVMKMLLRPDEAAYATGMSRTKIFSLISSGELRSIKHGRHRLVPVKEIESWVARALESV